MGPPLAYSMTPSVELHVALLLSVAKSTVKVAQWRGPFAPSQSPSRLPVAPLLRPFVFLIATLGEPTFCPHFAPPCRLYAPSRSSSAANRPSPAHRHSSPHPHRPSSPVVSAPPPVVSSTPPVADQQISPPALLSAPMLLLRLHIQRLQLLCRPGQPPCASPSPSLLRLRLWGGKWCGRGGRRKPLQHQPLPCLSPPTAAAVVGRWWDGGVGGAGHRVRDRAKTTVGGEGYGERKGGGQDEHVASRARPLLFVAGVVGVHVADQLQRLRSTAKLQGSVAGVGEVGNAAVELEPVLVAPHREAAHQLVAGEDDVRPHRCRRKLQRADLLPVLLLLALLCLLVVEGELGVGIGRDRRLRGAPGLLLIDEPPTQLVGVALLVKPQLPRRHVAHDLQHEVLLHRRDLTKLEGGLQQLLQHLGTTVGSKQVVNLDQHPAGHLVVADLGVERHVDLALLPAGADQHVVESLSSLPAAPDPESDPARAASPTVSRLLATAVTNPSFDSTAASALLAEFVDFAAACRLDYATALVAESDSASPPSVGGECALGTDVLKDRQEDFECLAAAVPRFASMLLAPEGDPDAPDIPTSRSYAEAITGPYSSQWQATMDAKMAS
ncbi:unnamed protein product [Closterium sp. NIES-53]